MLSESELAQLYRQLNLPECARLAIEGIRKSPPSRRVRSAGGNVCVRYPSRKMGAVIQAESHTVELAGVYEMEYDDNVLEYYDQPPPIKLKYLAKSGRAITVRHTPDFFVIRRDAVGWEEWKPEQGIPRLAEKMPHRYVRGEGGQWCCPPGENYASQLGLYYRLRSSAEISRTLQRNLIFLEDYLQHDATAREEAQVALALVAREPGIKLDDLLKCAKPASSDDVYTLIAAGKIYVDMRAVPLAEPSRVPVFISEEAARAYAIMQATSSSLLAGGSRIVEVAIGATIVWDGKPWMVANAGETTITLVAWKEGFVELPNATFQALVKHGKITGTTEPTPQGMNSEAKELLARATAEDLREANHRSAIVRAILAGQEVGEVIPERRVRYWVSMYKKAEQTYGYGYLGLLQRHYLKGNRNDKLPESTRAIMDKFVEENYETIKQKNRREVYGELEIACQEQGVTPPSYKRFAQAVKEHSGYKQTKKRQGKRAAEQKRPFYWELEQTTPRHGDRPFEIGHIDHTELDIELVCPHTGHNLGRPWATFLTDAFSRRLSAVYVTFDPPSYRSCMMVLRECVCRHSRLPQFVVVDGGPEFHGVYFETLLAFYGCAKKTRPGGKPRFGSVCERLFGTSNTEFIHNLTGNTQVTVNVRQVTKSINPREHAIWTLDRLHLRLCEWAYEVYDTIEHPALGQSPRSEFAFGLMQSGTRPQRLIPYDEDFKMLTLPTTSGGTALVQPNHGVKINYIYYWSDTFRNPEVERTRVSVRYDPFDAGVAYAHVNGRWVRCVSEHYAAFKGRSEREVKLASEALHKKNQLHSQQFNLTARKLANFIVSVEAEEVLLEQQLRDTSNRSVLATLGSNPPDSDHDSARMSLASTPTRDVPPQPESMSAGNPLNDYDHLEVYGEY